MVVVQGCWSARFDATDGTSLAQNLLTLPNAGAAVVVGYANESTVEAARPITSAFFDKVLSGMSIGRALTASRQAAPRGDISANFGATLLGDPALVY